MEIMYFPHSQTKSQLLPCISTNYLSSIYNMTPPSLSPRALHPSTRVIFLDLESSLERQCPGGSYDNNQESALVGTLVTTLLSSGSITASQIGEKC